MSASINIRLGFCPEGLSPDAERALVAAFERSAERAERAQNALSRIQVVLHQDAAQRGLAVCTVTLDGAVLARGLTVDEATALAESLLRLLGVGITVRALPEAVAAPAPIQDGPAPAPVPQTIPDPRIPEVLKALRALNGGRADSTAVDTIQRVERDGIEAALAITKTLAERVARFGCPGDSGLEIAELEGILAILDPGLRRIPAVPANRHQMSIGASGETET